MPVRRAGPVCSALVAVLLLAVGLFQSLGLLHALAPPLLVASGGPPAATTFAPSPVVHPTSIAYLPAAATAANETSASWTEPQVIYPAAWPDPLYTDLDDRGDQLVALVPSSGVSPTTRHVVVATRAGASWLPPLVVAQNGAWSDALHQVLPQRTHPVISGDGNTIAYVGYTGSTYGVYVIDRLATGGWGAPALVPTGLANTHYWIALSRDGRTLALCDYPYFGVQQVYVTVRRDGSWGAPVPIGAGGQPAISAGGRQIIYVANGRATFSEWVNGAWSTPQALTVNDPLSAQVEYPQVSADGWSVYYWLVTLTPDGQAVIRSAQELYVVRRQATGWGAPEQVTASPVLPSSATAGPAVADAHATRLVYTRAVTVTDPFNGEPLVASSHLELSERLAGNWHASRVVTATGDGNYNQWPQLTADGRKLFFAAGVRTLHGQAVVDGLWQTTASAAPPLPDWRFAVSGLLGPGGGTLFSPFDGIAYWFGPGTLGLTATLTHTAWTNPPPPPGALAPIGGLAGLGGLGGAFSTILMGPGGLPLQPLLPFTVTVDYGQTGTGTTTPGSLGLWRFSVDGWQEVPGQDDRKVGILTATVDHLSDFAVFGATYRLYLPLLTRDG